MKYSRHRGLEMYYPEQAHSAPCGGVASIEAQSASWRGWGEGVRRGAWRGKKRTERRDAGGGSRECTNPCEDFHVAATALAVTVLSRILML